MIYLSLFFEFFKIGLFAVGGGLATIPFLYALSEKTAWFSAKQLVDMIGISIMWVLQVKPQKSDGVKMDMVIIIKNIGIVR